MGFETEVVIYSGFVYVPLLYDPHLKAELEFLAGKGTLPPPGVIETIATNLIYADGGNFIKSLSLASLVDNYPAVFPEEYERERFRLIRHILPEGLAYQPPLDAKLKTILFEILPHFIRGASRLGAPTGWGGCVSGLSDVKGTGQTMAIQRTWTGCGRGRRL